MHIYVNRVKQTTKLIYIYILWYPCTWSDLNTVFQTIYTEIGNWFYSPDGMSKMFLTWMLIRIWLLTTLTPYSTCVFVVPLSQVYITFAGIAMMVLLVIPLVLSLEAFPRRHRGLISGMMQMFTSGGGASFMAIYNARFKGGPVGDFFLLFTVSLSIVCILCVLFLTRTPWKGDDESSKLFEQPAFREERQQNNAPQPILERFGCLTFCKAEFQLLLWGYVVSMGMKFMFIPNVTSIATSYGYSDLGGLLVTLGPLFSVSFGALYGIISDCTLQRIPRVAYAAFGSFFQGLLLFASMLWGNNKYLYIVTTLTLDGDIGVMFATIPPTIAALFGMKHFARNFGLLLGIQSVFVLVTDQLFGVFYEMAIPDGGETDCYGLQCYKYSYAVGSLGSFISAVLMTVLCYRITKGSCA